MNEVKFKANIKDLAALQAAVSEIPEIPTPATTDEGKVLTVSVDSSGETPVAEYELAAPASGLPAIGSGDAGKVLTVNAGETGAEWAAAGGGNSPMIVHAPWDATANLYVMDKTFGEIRAAVDASRPVLVVVESTSAVSEDNNTSVVLGYTYSIYLDPDYPSAMGSVSISGSTFDVQCSSAPYTLTALDAMYPGMS